VEILTMEANIQNPAANTLYSTHFTQKTMQNPQLDRQNVWLELATVVVLLFLTLSGCADSGTGASQRLKNTDPTRVSTLAKRLQAIKAQERNNPPATITIGIGQTKNSTTTDLKRVEAFAPKFLDSTLDGMVKTTGGAIGTVHICDRNRQPIISLTIDPPPRLDRQLQMPVDDVHVGDPLDTAKRLIAYNQKIDDVVDALDDFDHKKQVNEQVQAAKIAEFKQKLAASLKVPRSCQVNDLAVSLNRTGIFLDQQKALLPQTKKFSVVISDKLDFYRIENKVQRDRDTTLILVSATKQNAQKLSPNLQVESPSAAFISIDRTMQY
jgi:hypothetical protein